MSPYRIVAVVGSRTDKNAAKTALVYRIVEKFFKTCVTEADIILSGGCPKGVDYVAKSEAFVHGIRYIEAPPDWNKGAWQGPWRNETMARVCDIALVIWDGKSPGTASMIEALTRNGKPYWTVLI